VVLVSSTLQGECSTVLVGSVPGLASTGLSPSETRQVHIGCVQRLSRVQLVIAIER
jgi:hypothetical protein